MTVILSPQQTAEALPYALLAREIEALLQNPSVHVPPRIVQALHGGGSLFVMPAADARVAITKLISFIPTNAQRGLPTIQGDIVVFDVQTGQRIALLDGPTVTARRTAAVSLLAAKKLAPRRDGSMLIVGAGVQGKAHLEAFHQGLGVSVDEKAQANQNVRFFQFEHERGRNAVHHVNGFQLHVDCVGFPYQ